MAANCTFEAVESRQIKWLAKENVQSCNDGMIVVVNSQVTVSVVYYSTNSSKIIKEYEVIKSPKEE